MIKYLLEKEKNSAQYYIIIFNNYYLILLFNFDPKMHKNIKKIIITLSSKFHKCVIT